MSSTGRNLPSRPMDGLGAYDTPIPLYQGVYRQALEIGVITPTTPILEPHVGAGNLLEALVLEGHRGDVEVLDLDPLAPGLARARQLGMIVGCDVEDPHARRRYTASATARKVPAKYQDLVVDGFLVRRPKLAGPDVVTVGNPPYSVVPGEEDCPKCNGGNADGCSRCKGTGKVQPPAIAVAEYHVHRALEVSRSVIYVLRGPFREGQDRYLSLFSQDRLAEVWTSPRRASFKWGGTDSVETAVYWWERNRVRPPGLGDHGPAYVGRWFHW